MKKQIIIGAALLALGTAFQAAAANAPIYLTGSTAFRGNCYNVLKAATSAGGIWDSAPHTNTWGNSDPSKANYMLFTGKIGGVDQVISCAWSGSEAGISSVAGTSIDNAPFGPLPGAPETFIKTDGTVTLDGFQSGAPTTELESTSRQADWAMADTSKDVSLSSTATLHSFGTVGIACFTWVKNYETAPLPAWNHLTNITHGQAFNLLTFPQHASTFTGIASDTNYVYPVGRNKGSGTRVNELADTGYPITQPVVQFSIGGLPFSGGLTLVEVDNNGYESGGDVAKAVSVDGSQTQTDPNFTYDSVNNVFVTDGSGSPVTGWLAVGFLGCNDANQAGAADGGAGKLNLQVARNWLPLQGIFESDGAIEEGAYSAWGNEHMYGQNGISGTKLTIGNQYATALSASLTGSNPAAHSNGIQLSFMHAEKLTDTAVPTHIGF